MIEKIQISLKNNPDLIVKKINNKFTIIYFQSLCSENKINEYITNPIILTNDFSAPHTISININEVTNYLCNGFVITICNNKTLYAS